MTRIEEIAAIVEGGRAKEIEALVESALAEGCGAADILNDGMIAAMESLGEKFSRNEAFVPELMLAAKTMKLGVALLKPHMREEGAAAAGKVVIGTVKGDLHDIGKNLVAMMFECAGFEVIDLGVDVAPEDFVETVKENPETVIVGLSSLLTTAMPAMDDTVRTFSEAGLRDKVKIIIGGAPVTQSYADEIGADAYTPDAATAAQRGKQFVQETA